MNPQPCIFIAGGTTPIGAALLDRLRAQGVSPVGVPPDEPELTNPAQIDDFFAETRPDRVLLVAGKSGGIGLNRARPAELMLDNLLVTTTILDAAHRHGVGKLLYLASSCAYPRDVAQPMRVESLLAGPPEPTSDAYATAKLAGWKLCEAYRRQYGVQFITAFPANPFGPHDDFGPDSSHVIPALIRRAHEAKLRGDSELTVWGSGTPRREFILLRDLADACLFVLKNYDGVAPINLGVGSDLSIAEVAGATAEVVGYRGRIVFDTSKPDGAPLKRLDSGPLFAMGWRPTTDFRTALAETFDWFLHHGADDERQAVPRALPHPPRRGRDRARLSP